MKAEKTDIEFNRRIAYYSDLNAHIDPLRITNKSSKIYIFKVRTNQKNAISLFTTHGFLRPNSTLEIVIKLLEKPSTTIPLKLELNYTLATQEQLQNNDSKAALAHKKNLIKDLILLEFEEGEPKPVQLKTQEEKHESRNEESVHERNSVISQEGAETQQPTDENIPDAFNTVEIDPFLLTAEKPKVQASEEDKELGTFPGGLFRQTYSIDKRSVEIAQSASKEGQHLFKMNIFESALEKQQQQTSPICHSLPSKQEILNPFDILMQNTNPRSEQIEIEPNSQIKAIPIPMKSSSTMRESFRSIRNDTQPKENRQKQNELLELKIKIQCHSQFIKDLQGIPMQQKVKKYSKFTFVLFTILFFALGAAARRFAL